MEEFQDEIARSYEENGEPDATPIRLAKAEQRIREIEAGNRLLRVRIDAVEAERDNWKAAAKRLEEAVLKAGCAVDSFAFYDDCSINPNVRELRAERDAARQEVARLTERAHLLDWIEQKIGNVYEGIETVRLHRDDATNSFIVAIGKDSLAGYGPSLLDALRLARKDGK